MTPKYKVISHFFVNFGNEAFQGLPEMHIKRAD